MKKIRLTVKVKNRLKALMADAGFRSMKALAEETGISQNMLYLFERGEKSLALENICRLLWALDCRFEDLIQYEIDSNEPAHFDALSDEVKAGIEQAEADHQAREQDRKKGS